MKKIIMLFSLVGCLVSCNHNAPNEGKFEVEPNSGWVEFETTIIETSTVSGVSIPVYQRSAINEDATVITYKVEAAEGSTVPAGVTGTYTDTIPATELMGTLDFAVAETDASYSLIVTIIGTSQDNLQIGLAGEEGEHPFVASVKICDGTIASTYSGTAYAAGNEVVFTATFTPVEGQTNVYTIDTAWGQDFVAILAGDPSLSGQYPYSGTLTINADQTITIVGDESYATGGTGTYDVCNKTFTYQLGQTLFTGDLQIDVVLVAN